jgi:hypothetical protein
MNDSENDVEKGVQWKDPLFSFYLNSQINPAISIPSSLLPRGPEAGKSG